MSLEDNAGRYDNDPTVTGGGINYVAFGCDVFFSDGILTNTWFIQFNNFGGSNVHYYAVDPADDTLTRCCPPLVGEAYTLITGTGFGDTDEELATFAMSCGDEP